MAWMVRTICLLFAVFALAVQPMGTHPGSIMIGDAHAANPMVELLTGGDVVGDGATAVTLNIVAYRSNGQAMNGSTLKVYAQAGRIGRVSMVRPGLYAADWVPPKVDTVSDVTLSVKGKSPDGETISKTWAVAVRPSISQQVSISANPSSLTLGRDGGSTLSIQLSGADKTNLKDVELVVLTNSGTVENVTHLGDGTFAASYKPPKQFFPHLAMITVADKRDPNRTYGSFAIPLIGKANFPVVGQPRSNVLVRIDDREFGPVPADASGNAQVPIEVRPGFIDAQVISVLNGQKRVEPLDMQVPAANRVTLFPMSESVPSDPAINMPVRAYVLTAGGEPDVSARVKFTATSGSLSEAVHEGNGVFRADYTPSFGNQATATTITVDVDDIRGPQNASQNIQLIPARPGQVTLTPEPASLMKAAQSFQILAKIQSADGVGMPNRTLRFIANGATQSGAPLDLGSGDYKARFDTTGKGAVEVIATAGSPGSTNPLRSVLIFPSRDRLPNDGLSSAMMTVLTLDEYGYPVSNVTVNLGVITGEGSLPAQTTTDASGVGQVHFTAGRKAGIVRISASAGAHSSVTPILLAPDKVAADYALVPSGSAHTVNTYNAWRKIIQTARLERDGMIGAPIAGYSGGSQVGAVSTVQATAEPSQVAPGGTVVLRLQAKDADGRGVGGQTLQVVASPGEVSAVTDQGGGKYTASITVPAGVAGSVDVSVVIPTVQKGTTLKIPVTGGSWQSVGTATQGAQEEAPQKAKKEKKPKQPKSDSSDSPWLRAQAGATFGSYHYRQEPTVLMGPMYDFPITFGGSATSPAFTGGLSLSAKADIPPLQDYLSVSAKFRSVQYRIALPEFANPIADWLTKAQVVGLGKYTFDAGDVRAYGGLRLGFNSDDFLVFRQSGNTDVRVLDYGPLVVPGMLVGPEAGFTWNDTLFGQAAIDFTLANASSYYAFTTDLSVGYTFHESWYAFLGAEITRRSLAVYMIPDGSSDIMQVGVLDDHVNLFSLGIGWQM